MNRRWGIAVALAAVAVGLSGCGSTGDGTPAPSAPSLSTVATTAPAWSSEAVTACRTFINSVPNLTLVESLIGKTRPVSDSGWNEAVTGWGLATAGMYLPASTARAAEPQVYQALSAVSAALETSPVNDDYSRNPAYVDSRVSSFKGALAICSEVGVDG